MQGNDLTGKAVDLFRRLGREGREDDALVVRQMAGMLGMEMPTAVEGRIRKPQDHSQWPDSLSQAEVEALVDAKCGCSGNYDCDCISVFNQTRMQAWYDHNTAERDGDMSGPRL